MEAVKTRSESPFTKSKTKGQSSDVPENGDAPSEQVKTKKKQQKNKHKTQLNGEALKNGTESQREDITPNHTNNDQNGMIEPDEDKENDQGNDNSNAHQTTEEVARENGTADESIDVCGDGPVNKSNGHVQESAPADCSDEVTNNLDEKAYEENELTNETESSAKKSNGLVEDEAVTTPEDNYGNEDLDNEANGISNISTEVNIEEVSYIESTQNGLNNSDDGSHYEDAQTKDDHIQASPDTATKEESFFSNKISNFLGKWTPSSPQQDTKHDSGISSSQNANGDGSVLIHPYLSKVSGRRGIRERMNSSTASLNSKDEDMKTPTNLTTALDDSFRVRTNPSRLNATDILVNPTLRKFKGKRCLNANDEPEDEDEEVYLASNKRRKLNDKAQDSGLLSTIFLSPFRKKPTNIENSLKPNNPESKLSRFLSPFWFWKKTAVAQKGK